MPEDILGLYGVFYLITDYIDCKPIAIFEVDLGQRKPSSTKRCNLALLRFHLASVL